MYGYGSLGRIPSLAPRPWGIPEYNVIKVAEMRYVCWNNIGFDKMDSGTEKRKLNYLEIIWGNSINQGPGNTWLEFFDVALDAIIVVGFIFFFCFNF